MPRSRRYVLLLALSFGAAWTVLMLYSSRGRGGEVGVLSAVSNTNARSFSVPPLNPMMPAEDSIPNGLNAHKAPRVSRQLTEEELNELSEDQATGPSPESVGEHKEDEAVESADSLLPPSEGKDMPPSEEEEMPPSEKKEMPPSEGKEMPPSEGKDMPSSEGNEASQSNEKRNRQRQEICGYYDSEVYSKLPVSDQQYIKKTFLRAWYARGYYPRVLESSKLKSSARALRIDALTDKKARMVAQRLEALALASGELMTDVCTLSEPSRPLTEDNHSSAAEALSRYIETGFLNVRHHKEYLDSLLDSIAKEEYAVASIIQAIGPDKFRVDERAVEKIAAAVQRVSTERKVTCRFAPPSFLLAMNKDYRCVSDGESLHVDTVFIDLHGRNEKLFGLFQGNDSLLGDLKHFLSTKLLLPANNLNQALVMLEYSFGVFFNKGPIREVEAKEGSEEEPLTDQSKLDLLDWARERIDEQWLEVEEIERQASV